MSNRHFKLNTVKLNSYSLAHHTCSSYKLLPRPQTLVSRLTFFSHISPIQLVNPTGSIIQVYPASSQISPPLLDRHISGRLVYHYGLVSKHSQNIPFKIYIRSHPTCVQSHPMPSPPPVPHSVSSMPDTLEPLGSVLSLPVTIFPLTSHTWPLTFFKSLPHVIFSVKTSSGHSIQICCYPQHSLNLLSLIYTSPHLHQHNIHFTCLFLFPSKNRNSIRAGRFLFCLLLNSHNLKQGLAHTAQ